VYENSYSAFEHLCKSLFAKKDDIFVVLTAYLDDSGTSPTDAVAVVAGYLATRQMWDKFDSRWFNLLAKYGVKILHRADLESFHGEFKGWNPQRRTEFLKAAHTIIRNCTYTAVGLALVKSDYGEIISNHETLRRFGIYSWCAQGCLLAFGCGAMTIK
jgi:hypothetical protein